MRIRTYTNDRAYTLLGVDSKDITTLADYFFEYFEETQGHQKHNQDIAISIFEKSSTQFLFLCANRNCLDQEFRVQAMRRWSLKQ
jgi:CDP-diacylglycerol pyrophosphatase